MTTGLEFATAEAWAIVKREGGWVDDPDDMGGATKHGVTIRYMRGKGIDLDGDGDVDKDDVRLVTPEHAVAYFLQDFYKRPRINQLPDFLQPQVFDMAVNHGPYLAVSTFQEALLKLGADLMPDGLIGPKTRAATDAMVAEHGEKAVNNAVVDARLDLYKRIIRKRPSQKKYQVGWNKRARSFRL